MGRCKNQGSLKIISLMCTLAIKSQCPWFPILSSLRVHRCGWLQPLRACQQGQPHLSPSWVSSGFTVRSSLMATSFVYPYDRKHFLFKTVRYFSRKDEFIWEQQKIAICGQLPWKLKSKSHLPVKENILCYREEKEVERAAVNKSPWLFIGWVLARKEEESLLTVGLWSHCRAWELPLLVSQFNLTEVSVCLFTRVNIACSS